MGRFIGDFLKLYYTWNREGAENGPESVELPVQEYPGAEAAALGSVLLGSLDRRDYLPPPAAAPAPHDVILHPNIGHAENAG